MFTECELGPSYVTEALERPLSGYFIGMRTVNEQGAEEMNDLVASENVAMRATASPRRTGLGTGSSAPLANPRRVRAVAWPAPRPVDLLDSGDSESTGDVLDLTEAAS
jgi:hypothetical protein